MNWESGGPMLRAKLVNTGDNAVKFEYFKCSILIDIFYGFQWKYFICIWLEN